MKQNGTLSDTRLPDNIQEVNHLNGYTVEEIGDQHLFTSFETPLRDDAFELDDDTKIELIEKHFEGILNSEEPLLHLHFKKLVPRYLIVHFCKIIIIITMCTSGLKSRRGPTCKDFLLPKLENCWNSY